MSLESSSSSRFTTPSRRRLSRRRSADLASLRHSAEVAAAYDALVPQEASIQARQQWMRDVLWRHYGRLFTAGHRVLDVGCGSGPDTLYLARRGCLVTAIDLSSRMIEALTATLIETSSGPEDLSPRVLARAVDAAEIATWPGPYFHGVVSSFGALNTVNDLAGFAADAARLLLPAGRLVAHMLAPGDSWQRRQDVRREGRRAARELVNSRRRDLLIGGQPVRHRIVPWWLAYRRYFRPHFRLRGVYGLGSLLPEWRMAALPVGVSGLIARLERILGTVPPWLHRSRYYVLDLEPRPEIGDKAGGEI